MNAPPRVAIVGAGLMGRWHAQAAARAGGRVTAIVDPDGSRGERLARRIRGCDVFTELASCLGRVDVVHLCTPAETHVALANQILSARRHLLVEKPFAPTQSDTMRLLAAADREAVLVCPVYQFRFQDGARTALDRLGGVSRLRHVDITICSAGAAHADVGGRARIAEDVLPHGVSLLQRWLPGDIARAAWTVDRPLAGEIRAMTMAGGVTASLLVSMSGRPPINRAVLIGSEATVEVDLFHGYAVTHRGRVSRIAKAVSPFVRSGRLARAAGLNLARRAWRRQPAYPGLQELVSEFYRAVRDGGLAPIAPSETAAIAAALDRLHSAPPSGHAERDQSPDEFCNGVRPQFP